MHPNMTRKRKRKIDIDLAILPTGTTQWVTQIVGAKWTDSHITQKLAEVKICAGGTVIASCQKHPLWTIILSLLSLITRF